MSFPSRILYMSQLLPVLLFCRTEPSVSAEPVVPGSGVKIQTVGDDFEDERWVYIFNNPKSSHDIDFAERFPVGEAANGRWYEGAKRGHPDIIKRVATPVGGLPGSRGSLLLQSLSTGVPGRPRHQMGQDDFIADVNYRLGGAIPVWRVPSVAIRVFLPPVGQWENRTGPQFGFRASLEANLSRSGPSTFLSGGRPVSQTYWPGMFIEFESKPDEHSYDYAYLRLRADRGGNDVRSKQITTTGWWTLGFSFTSDGMVHYYAKPGVEALTKDDRLASEFPYDYRADRFKTFFFNVCSGDDGRSWSTPWVIDDPSVYVVR